MTLALPTPAVPPQTVAAAVAGLRATARIVARADQGEAPPGCPSSTATARSHCAGSAGAAGRPGSASWVP